MAFEIFLLPLIAVGQVAATDSPPGYLNTLFDCEVRRITNFTTLEPESQSPTFAFKVWYGPIPRSGDEFGDEHGGVAVLVDPSDVLPNEYRYSNELPQEFYVKGDRGEGQRILRIAPLADANGAFDALIISFKQGARPNTREAADALHGICRRRDMTYRQFRETVWRPRADS